MSNEKKLAEEKAKSSKALREAASVLVVRDQSGGMEVLMLSRPEREGDLYSGAWVFPGGVVDAGDHELYAHCVGVDDAAASRRLGLAANGLAYYVAAIRECFEEVGLLLAYGKDDTLLRFDHTTAIELRAKLHAGEITFGQVCRDYQLKLAADRLHYQAHWLTPAGLPKRFDTRFFVAIAPGAQNVAHDGREALQSFWLRPAEALARAKEGKMRNATQKSLVFLQQFPTAEACLEHTRNLREIVRILPQRANSLTGPRGILPEHPAYAEVRRMDPEGRGNASCEIIDEVPVRLSARIIRITAANGSHMTGPGTNTYFVGNATTNEWAMIDPGPAMESHVQAIMAAAPGPIHTILVTHTHKDHSPAAVRLKELTGARLCGMPPPPHDGQDQTFVPDRVLKHGDKIKVAESVSLRVIHTPGHASNHLCYLLEEEKTLFTGDHLMQGSTVVINPPDGNMIQYLASLNMLLAEGLEWLAPGHGHLMDRPRLVVERTMAHRLAREAKVLVALRDLAPADLDKLLPRVYDDVAPFMHPVAKRSLSAHLEKLAHDGLARESAGVWQAQ